MNSRMPAATRAHSGYALLVVLFFVGLIGMLSAGYLRHAMTENRHSTASVSAQDAAHAVDAALAWGQQSVLTDADATTANLGNGRTTAFVQTEDLGNNHRRLLATALDSDGLGTTVLAEGELMPLALADTPDDLPQLDPEVSDALVPGNTSNSHCGSHGNHGSSSAVATTYYSGTQSVSDRDLTGLVVIRNSARITFSNVTIAGCIVSERALGDVTLGAFQVSTAPTVIIDGGLRVSGGSFLPGIAVLMPDGVLKCSTGACSVQLMGDVVTHTLTLTGAGGILGNIACVQSPSIATTIGLPGAGRAPRAWAAGLQLGDANAFRYLAFLPRTSTVDGLSSITSYQFP